MRISNGRITNFSFKTSVVVLVLRPPPFLCESMCWFTNSNCIGLRLNLDQYESPHYKGQIEFLTNFAVVRGQAGGGLIGSKSYNLQRRDQEPIKTVGSDLVNKLCKCGETIHH